MKMNEMKVVDNKDSYNKIADYIELAVVSSYGEDGRYHQYLNDFAKAVAVISMYTDYDGNDFSFAETMDFIHSPEWKLIVSELGYKYYEFISYVDAEIAYKNTPMREMDDTIKELREILMKVTKVLSAINIDALEGYDFSRLFNAIDKVNEHSVNEYSVNNKEEDNVVPIIGFTKKDN